jgi:Transglutaminase-like superfamily
MNKLKTLFRLPTLERRLILEAVYWCALIRLIIMVIPFRKYVWLLGKKRLSNKGQPASVSSVKRQKEALLLEIGSAVQRASRNVPWRTRCYVEAIVAKRMLKRRDIPCNIHLGLKKDLNTDTMTAHAWMTCGDIIVTGGPQKNLKEFTTISTFR